jgi:hypothetical protein
MMNPLIQLGKTTLVRLVALALACFGFAAGAVAQRMEINFHDEDALLPITKKWSGVLDTRANFYKEKGMVFTDGVNPPDPALGAILYYHYHLMYQDPRITFGFADPVNFTGYGPGRLFPIPVCCPIKFVNIFLPLDHPEKEDRVLKPMDPGAVVQMTYDPDYDPRTGGVPNPHPFNLISLVVREGRLNVGTKSPTTGISVYNNLTAGFEWSLIDANNLTRATLEWPVPFGLLARFSVDKIIFEPSSPGRAPTARSPTKTTSIRAGDAKAVELETNEETVQEPASVLHSTDDPLLVQHQHLATPVFDALEVEEAKARLEGPGQDQFHVRGHINLGAESDGVHVRKEDVMITFGPFRAMIPAPLFNLHNVGGGSLYEFDSTLAGITKMQIAVGQNRVNFLVQAKEVDLSEIDLNNKVAVSLQIGNDLGGAQVRVDRETGESPNDSLQPMP